MLYKKYHRSFVSQFKKRAKVGYRREAFELVDIVKIEPYVDIESQINFFRGIRMTGINFVWTLVFPSGYINHEVKAIENVI